MHAATEEWRELLNKVANGLMVRTDSRKVQPGEVFVAMPGAKESGSKYIFDALERGAGYVVADHPGEWVLDSQAQFVFRQRTDESLGDLASAYFKTNHRTFKLVGVTGTNGKTTTTYVIEHLLRSAGRGVGVLGTIAYRWPNFTLDATLTTPSCWHLHSLFFNMNKADVDVAVMEVSSHALEQQRVAGLNFDAAVLTNVSQDHLDYHGDMESYFRAKSRLFYQYQRGDKVGVINFNDPMSRRILCSHKPVLGYGLGKCGLNGAPALEGEILFSSIKGMHLRMSVGEKKWEIESPLIGEFNAYNLLAAQALGLSFGLDTQDMEGLCDFMGVPGRLERIPSKSGLDVFVDYAHTPDALDNVLRALSGLDFKRLIVVFGCGGDRDKTKRPLMGNAVARYADVAVLTSDNPRHEDPLDIIADTRPGLKGGSGSPLVVEEPDRGLALKMTVEMMEPGDLLVVAGKGHETKQQIGDEFLPFSDAEVLKQALEEAGK